MAVIQKEAGPNDASDDQVYRGKARSCNPEGEKATGPLLRWRRKLKRSLVTLVRTHSTLLLSLVAVRKQEYLR